MEIGCRVTELCVHAVCWSSGHGNKSLFCCQSLQVVLSVSQLLLNVIIAIQADAEATNFDYELASVGSVS